MRSSGEDSASNLATAHLLDRYFDLVDPADHMALIDELAQTIKAFSKARMRGSIVV